jgi:serine/threonine-protein kinase
VTDLRAQLQATLGDAYTLERELGGGGMSRVFVATETALGRKVVVKVLPAETAAQVSIERFKREIMLAARLQHPHIVPLHSAGESQGLPYFTMPFVEGESLRVRLAKQGELPVSEAIRILREIASALSYAHEHGIVHRDIKPDNVLLSGGSAMVTDFGVAKALSASSNAEHGAATSLGVALGTPAYMAPEQATADPAMDHRADIYAFGVLAYELLTGQPPFVGRTPQNLLAAHVTEAPETISKRRATLPPALAALVMRCLEKRPADRAQTVAEIVHALDTITAPSGGTQPTGAVAATLGTAAPATASGGRTKVFALAAVVLLVVATGVYWSSRRGTPGAAQSIAVLPLTNVGGDSATDFFADGMTDELTVALGKVPGLHVAARSAAYAFHERTVDPKEAGAKLHVASILEGGVRRSGNRMRVTVQLLNAADGLSLWSDSYDRDVKDAYDVQNEIAQAIAGALKITLGAGQRVLAVAGTQSPEAHDLYLQGLFHKRRFNEPDLRLAISLFEKSVAKDPAYAAAWAGLAGTWQFLADDWLPPREAIPKSRLATQKALAIDPTGAEAVGAMGMYAVLYDYNPAAGLPQLRRAQDLDPKLAEVATWLARTLAGAGKRDSALAAVRRAAEADPISATAAAYVGWTFTQLNELDSAETWLRHARELDPSYGLLADYFARLRTRQGRCTDALAELGNTAVQVRGESLRAYCEAQLGRTAEARARLARLESARKTRYVAADYIALGYVALGDHDAAFRWLNIAVEERSFGVAMLYLWLWDPIRSDPRFRSLEQRIAHAGPMTP